MGEIKSNKDKDKWSSWRLSIWILTSSHNALFAEPNEGGRGTKSNYILRNRWEMEPEQGHSRCLNTRSKKEYSGSGGWRMNTNGDIIFIWLLLRGQAKEKREAGKYGRGAKIQRDNSDSRSRFPDPATLREDNNKKYVSIGWKNSLDQQFLFQSSSARTNSFHDHKSFSNVA